MTAKDTDILHYEMRGKGPTIVFLHGYLSAGRYWDDICGELKENHTVIAIDLLNFFRNNPISSTLELESSKQTGYRTCLFAMPCLPNVPDSSTVSPA